ncbi:MAG: 2-succinyl-5-enolpyruvyl-6-hydroxy-3-cyclohexene-1-carboxylic-acid synthase [Oligoflexia bacterium]|nr:2-succinyl-5-enolpyruvyl-6-hydroxy-3-cyclohexene-1-carboxylic-acid synthase [Oligoflexia bacterium]
MSKEFIRENTLRICEFFKQREIKHIIISPGFRNAPLSLAFSEDSYFKITTVIDERSNGFFALGIAKATKKPSIILTTSGTAVGNLYPAVMEAYHSKVPLIILSADRPMKALATGANQTTNQTNFFHPYTKDFFDFDFSKQQNKELEFHLARITNSAIENDSPVQLNLRLDEPYLGSSSLEKDHPIPKIFSKKQESLIQMIELLKKAKNPVFFAGINHHLSSDVLSILEEKNIPILTENSSNLSKSKKNIISNSFDFFHQIEKNEVAHPDLFLFLGMPPINTKIYEKVAKLGCKIASIYIKDEILDPDFIFSDFFKIDFRNVPIEDWLELPKIEIQNQRKYKPSENTTHYASSKICEPSFFRLFSKTVKKSTYFLGNSMPVRDFNKYFSGEYEEVYTNRGLSGIDGLLATAAGVSYGLKKQVISFIGDLSFLHDISSLSLLNRLPEINLKIFVLNNGGGEIFRVVNTKNFSEKSELFTTPQLFSISNIASGFSIAYKKIENKDELLNIISGLQSNTKLEIIEVIIDKEENHKSRNL